METNAMDVDMDIDLGGGPDEEVLEAENMAIEEAHSNMNNIDVGTAETDLAPEKVHIRGLDNLTTDDIKAFAIEHFPTQEVSRIEWIDDTSANIVYPSSELAAEALLLFSQDTDLDATTISSNPLELRQAKNISSHPDTELHVRLAVVTDVKAPRAREASRFYLLNPDKDPAERRHRDGHRRGGGARGPKRRRDEDDEVPFDVNMYDDDAGSLSARIDRPLMSGRRPARRLSDDLMDRDHRSRSKRPRTGTVSGGGDLFADRLRGRSGSARLRDRSASPLKAPGGDGRYGFAEEASGAIAQTNARELFPTATPIGRSKTLLQTQGKELFPNHSSPLRPERELFAERMSGTPASIHRRTDAFDANDETPEHISRSPLLIKGKGGRGSLADRITSGANGAGTPLSLDQRISKPDGAAGSLENRITGGPGADAGMSIRGAAGLGPGFSIKGAATAGAAEKLNPRVRELFPEKAAGADNSGKELFGRATAPRRRAGDLFG